MSTQDPGTPRQPPPATPGQPPPTTPAQAQPPAPRQTTDAPPNPHYPVKLDIAYDSASTRADVLLRFITVIPPLLYGWLMSFVFLFRWIQVWFTVLTTGKVPRDAFDFMVQFLRWAAWFNA